MIAARSERTWLVGTVNLKAFKLLAIGFKAYLHRLAADLAVFDIRLPAGGQINDNLHRLGAIRAADSPINGSGVHTSPDIALVGVQDRLRI